MQRDDPAKGEFKGMKKKSKRKKKKKEIERPSLGNDVNNGEAGDAQQRKIELSTIYCEACGTSEGHRVLVSTMYH